MTVGVGEILPLALVVTISPLNIIPAILLLSTARPLVAATTKNIVMAAAAAAAAATIASGGLATGEEIAVVGVSVAIAALGVLTPILVTVLLGARASDVLEGWNQWLRQNNATVMSVLFVVFGVVLIGQGMAGV